MPSFPGGGMVLFTVREATLSWIILLPIPLLLQRPIPIPLLLPISILLRWLLSLLPPLLLPLPLSLLPLSEVTIGFYVHKGRIAEIAIYTRIAIFLYEFIRRKGDRRLFKSGPSPFSFLVEQSGIEPPASRVRFWRSPSWATAPYLKKRDSWSVSRVWKLSKIT